jgi:hypothetical protein
MRTDGQERGIPQHAPSQCDWSEAVMEKGSSTAGGLGCRCPLIMRLRSEFKEKENVPRTVDSYSSKKKGGSFYGLYERERKREDGAGRKGYLDGLTAYTTSD